VPDAVVAVHMRLSAEHGNTVKALKIQQRIKIHPRKNNRPFRKDKFKV